MTDPIRAHGPYTLDEQEGKPTFIRGSDDHAEALPTAGAGFH